MKLPDGVKLKQGGLLAKFKGTLTSNLANSLTLRPYIHLIISCLYTKIELTWSNSCSEAIKPLN